MLKDYNGTLPESFLATWQKKDYSTINRASSWICLDALQRMADKLGKRDTEGRLARTVARVKEGADIGCRRSPRPSSLETG